MGWKDAVIMGSLINDHRFSFHRVPAAITTWQENEGELLLEFFRHFGYVRLWVPGELLLLPRGGCRSGWCCERGKCFFWQVMFFKFDCVCAHPWHTPHLSCFNLAAQCAPFGNGSAPPLPAFILLVNFGCNPYSWCLFKSSCVHVWLCHPEVYDSGAIAIRDTSSFTFKFDQSLEALKTSTTRIYIICIRLLKLS